MAFQCAVYNMSPEEWLDTPLPRIHDLAAQMESVVRATGRVL